MLGKLSNPINQTDLYKLINKVEHAINNSVHSSTLKTPSMILFGVDQKGRYTTNVLNNWRRRREHAEH